MKLLFWNINKKPLINEIKWLCDTYDVDILILAENPMDDNNVCSKLNENCDRFFHVPFHPSRRITFYSRYQLDIITDSNWGSVRKITHPIGVEFLLVAVHLPSKLHFSTEEQGLYSRRIIDEINSREQEHEHTRTLVIGDFNMNPFDSGMIKSEGFHAVMDKNIALKKHRTVSGKRREYFYNPMWSRMGDTSIGAAGTHYYNKSTPINYFWNTFDQVLIRPSLLPAFNDKNLKIIEIINDESLMKNGKISKQFSDHLPLLIELKISNLNLENNL